MTIDRDEILGLTQEYGGSRGANHALRILRLVSLIAEGLRYDEDVVWVAAQLHDWGAFSRWSKDGVDHAVRSGEVAKEFLEARGHSGEFVERTVACIVQHHCAQPGRSIESMLLSDADALDFLGIVGLARDLCKNPRNLKAGLDASRRRREKLPAALQLDRSKAIAARRIEQMDVLFDSFERDTFGLY